MARFFIDRPVFAWVLAIVTMLAGALSILRLPVEQYPSIAPPTVAINASYPGANAQTVENSVTQIIEQRLTGIDYLRYFNSSSSDGTMTITLTFEPEADPDIAQVQTQNKIQAALTQLPQEVQALGVRVTKSNNNFLLVIGLTTTDGSISQQTLADIAVSKLQEVIARTNGVGDVNVFGDQHAMRIWLDPDRLFSYNLTVLDVRRAIEVQNMDVSSGQLGGLPAVKGQQLNATITAQSRLKTVDDFNSILIKVNPDGSQIRLKDVARVELGSEGYSRIVRYKQRPAVGMGVSLATGANALETADAIKTKMKELASFLPPEVEVIYPYDTTPFVKVSIMGVVRTLIEAVILVFLVMYLFLQNIRATLVPTIAVPVVLLGTFAVLAAFGFSINVLTMFAMVLAIGLLVDDAIVVVENVERIMAEEGLSPKEATRKSMDQISGALIGIALVLSAVFVPMAFFSGSAGAIYRQFSITIVSAMALSVLVAMILSPSLCATLLKPVEKGHGEKTTGFFGWFNRHFNRSRDLYQKGSRYISGRKSRFFAIYGGLLAVMVFIFFRIPTSFLPDEDQGNMMMMINTPASSTAERTMDSVKQVESYLLENESDTIKHLFTVVGFSFAGSAQNAAIGFAGLHDWDERSKKEQHVFSLAQRTMQAFSQIKDATAFSFYPPPIRELGNASGFDFQLVDRSGHGHEELMKARGELLGKAAENPLLTAVRPNGLDDVPQYRLTIDNEKATAMGVSISDINQTLQSAWGSTYINDFVDQGRIKRVYMQADAPYRMLPEDINRWYVRNNAQEMVPFSSFSTAEWSYGSPKLERFNGLSSVNIQGAPAPGISSGVAMAQIQKIVNELPEGFGLEWSGLSYEERLSGAQTPALYALSILVVFLCLAALYESWSVPFAVMLAVPLGIIGTILTAWIAGKNNDVYFQVALLTTVGLSSKNAILIVEFAKDLYDEGHDLIEATLSAAKLRFRPILMTSIAFILGVTPLAIASGAGSASQNAIGLGVMGGMVAATTIAIFFVPMFYIFIQGLTSRKSSKHHLLITSTLFLSSCAIVGPDYKRPELNLPEHYNAESKLDADKVNLQKSDTPQIWWQSFKDPVLEDLIKLSSEQNLNIQIALQRVQQAKALSYNALADFLPVAGIFGQYIDNKTSAARFPGLATQGIEFQIYTAGVDVSWELDLFGRIARSFEAIRELENKAVFNSIDALNMLQSEIAIAYIQLRGAQNQKHIAETNAKNQNDTLSLLEKRFTSGIIGSLDLERAKAQNYLTRSKVVAYDTLINNALNRISSLLGKYPGDLPSDLKDIKPIPKYEGPVTISEPAQIIARRPDLRMAEAQAHSATAEVGLHMADLFPRISFTGALSRDARHIGDLDDRRAAEAYTFGPRITWAILDAPHIVSRIKASRRNAQAEVLTYQNSVIKALEEVDNSLVAIGNLQESLELLSNAAESSRKAEQIAKAQYEAGFISYLDLLLAQTSTLEAENTLAQAQIESSLSFVSLFKALGGAWEEEKTES